MTYTNQRGFTLLEIIIVMGLVGVIAMFGVAMSLSSVSRSSVMQERDLFVTLLLRGARAEAIANVGEISHGVEFDNANHRYILFEGNDPSDDPSTNRIVVYTNESITINNTGGSTIVFEQLSGDVTTGAGTITLSNRNSTQEIIIREVGQIDW